MSNKTNSRPDVAGTLKKLQAKDPGLKRLLEKAHGYAVFPSVGKAGAVVGGGYGRGDVFEKGRLIGHAKITQLTVGVQLGGDTFSEIVVFEKKEDLERFKRGKTAFAANASAVLVKAGAASAKNFSKGVAVYVWPEGGMLLELGLGGQRFTFKPADREQGEGEEEGDEERRGQQRGKGAQGRGQEEDDESGEGEEQEQGEEGDEEGAGGAGGGGNRALELAGRAVGGVRRAASKATAMAKRHPVAATVAGVGLATGLGLLIARAMRSGADDQGEDDQDAGGEEDEQDEGAQDSAEDSADDSDEDDDRAEDQSDEDEDEDEDEGEAQDEQDQGEDDESEEDEEESDEEESSNRGVLSRLLSRGKSRP